MNRPSKADEPQSDLGRFHEDPAHATPSQNAAGAEAKTRQISVALWISTSILVCGALYFASRVLIPVAIAFLASLALRPIVERLRRRGLPRAVTAAGLLLLFSGVLAVGIATATRPAQAWLQTAPQRLAEVSQKLEGANSFFAFIDQAEEQIDELSENGQDAPLEVEVKSPRIIDREVAINNLGRALALLLAVGVLTFFLLATGDDLINRLLHLMPSFRDERRIVSLIIEIQNTVGHYLGTILVINIGLGVAVALAMWALGMPTPLLWGALATCFNFIPYVGALAAALIIFFAAATEFEPLWRAFLTTGCFVALTSIEGNFVTPSILGRTLRIGPVVVLLAIAFWGFLWGIAGVFVAIPMLIVLRITCNAFPATRPIAILLGEEPRELEDSVKAGEPSSKRAKENRASLDQEGSPAVQRSPANYPP